MLSGASVSSQCIVAATSSALLILFRGIIPTAASLDASDEVMGEESLVSVSPGATASVSYTHLTLPTKRIV